MATPPPPKKFKAECPKCGKLAEHEELFRHKLGPGGAPLAAALRSRSELRPPSTTPTLRGKSDGSPSVPVHHAEA